MRIDEAYRLLGLTPPVTADELKRAYRKKALEFHPDRYQDAGEKAFYNRKFMQVREAYAALRGENFPELPEEPVSPPDFGPKTAGRSFAPREHEDVGQAEKLGIRVPWTTDQMVTWGVLLPASAAVLVYFVKMLVDYLKGG